VVDGRDDSASRATPSRRRSPTSPPRTLSTCWCPETGRFEGEIVARHRPEVVLLEMAERNLNRPAREPRQLPTPVTVDLPGCRWQANRPDAFTSRRGRLRSSRAAAFGNLQLTHTKVVEKIVTRMSSSAPVPTAPNTDGELRERRTQAEAFKVSLPRYHAGRCPANGTDVG